MCDKVKEDKSHESCWSDSICGCPKDVIRKGESCDIFMQYMHMENAMHGYILEENEIQFIIEVDNCFEDKIRGLYSSRGRGGKRCFATNRGRVKEEYLMEEAQ